MLYQPEVHCPAGGERTDRGQCRVKRAYRSWDKGWRDQKGITVEDFAHLQARGPRKPAGIVYGEQIAPTVMKTQLPAACLDRHRVGMIQAASKKMVRVNERSRRTG